MVAVGVPAASLSGVTVEIEPATDGNSAVSVEETTGAFTVTAGALRVEIVNLGFVQMGDLETDATIDGNTISPKTAPVVFEAILNPVTNVYKRLPEISGDGNGARVRITTIV